MNSADLSPIKVSLRSAAKLMSDDSLFFRWEGRGVQSTLFHLDGDVEEIVVAFAPEKRGGIMSNEKNKLRRMLLRDERSHGLSFFPRLPPDVYTMSTDEDGAGFWVFLHCPSHPLF